MIISIAPINSQRNNQLVNIRYANLKYEAFDPRPTGLSSAILSKYGEVWYVTLIESFINS